MTCTQRSQRKIRIAQESSVEAVFVVAEGKTRENHSKRRNGQRRRNEWTAAERKCQRHGIQVLRCLEQPVLVYLIEGQEIWAVELIILEVEGATGFKAKSESGDIR